MFYKATPESAGLSSRKILGYLKRMDERELASHAILIARGDRLVLEAYWSPFEASTKHRMYSQTKSYVGLAVRLLADEGRISLDAPIIDYFPEKLPAVVHPFLAALTVRHMLEMRTCFDEYDKNWFRQHEGDRVKMYFSQTPALYPGTQYRYDSCGSFVLGALVEKITGQNFLDYLREKCLRAIGFSEDAYCLKCPGGYAWADSALICTPLDMLKYGRFIGQYGAWEGKQIIRRGIIEEALADVSGNLTEGYRSFSGCGYSGQFWHFYGNSFGFNGMHDQFTLYDPDTDITFTCTSGNHRTEGSRELLFSYLFSEIIENAGAPMPEDPEGYGALQAYVAGLRLVAATGAASSPLEREISGKTFAADENPMGIREYSLTFEKDACVFRYVNAQGKKEILVGRGKNEIGAFPQTGYSGAVGGEVCEGNTYLCASSFAWETENQLFMRIQIIDVYIGVLYVSFAYRDGHARVRMVGDAENFLEEYNGAMNAVVKE